MDGAFLVIWPSNLLYSQVLLVRRSEGGGVIKWWNHCVFKAHGSQRVLYARVGLTTRSMDEIFHARWIEIAE